MSHSLKSLLHRDARADGASFPITELFYEPESRRLRYAALDVGGWFERREVLVALDRFGTPAEDGWPVAMDRDEIEQAPDWTDAPSAPSSLPPLVVGPFGSTFSPLLFAAQLQTARESRAEAEQDEPPKSSLGDASGRVLAMDPASIWLGREAFGPDGSLGLIEDVSVADDLTLQDFAFSDGADRPMSRLRHIAEQGHAVFD